MVYIAQGTQLECMWKQFTLVFLILEVNVFFISQFIPFIDTCLRLRFLK